MHEMSLCESVLAILENEAKTQHFQRVKTVWLEIGALAGVEIDAMRFCFDIVCKDTVADQAALEIVSVPGQAWCFHCQTQVNVTQRYAECPLCGQYQLQINDGEQLRVKELEVE